MQQTFKQYLFEAEANPKHIIELLQHDCAPFLKDVGGLETIMELYDGRPTAGLLRGMETNEPFMTKHVRKNRQPVDTKAGMHEHIDDWFKTKFGHPYRSNAIFTTNHPGQARAYGPIYWIFPVGQYNACWSPKVRDLFNLLAKEGLDKHNVTGSTEAKLDGIFEKAEYREGKLTKGILQPPHGLSAGYEIMVACESYHAISRNTMEAIYYTMGGK